MNASEGAPGRWWALAGLCTAAGLVWLAFADESIALPTISKELSLSLTDLQWTNNAFSLVCGALVALAFQHREGSDQAHAAGLSDAQLDQLRHTLASGQSAAQVLDTLPESSRAAVKAGYETAQAVGTAAAVKVGAVLALLSALVVLWLWPRAKRAGVTPR